MSLMSHVRTPIERPVSKNDVIHVFELTIENMRAFMTVKTAINRACPFCAAKPNQGCTTLGGRKRKVLHKQRIATVRPKAIEDWDGRAVWIWVERLSHVVHMGSLIYQLAKRNEDRLVHLRVWYQFKDRLPPRPELREDGYRLGLLHNGKIDGYRYHVNTRSCLLVDTVPPQNIELVKEYNLVELLK